MPFPADYNDVIKNFALVMSAVVKKVGCTLNMCRTLQMFLLTAEAYHKSDFFFFFFFKV